jgi:heat shock protein HslJ
MGDSPRYPSSLVEVSTVYLEKSQFPIIRVKLEDLGGAGVIDNIQATLTFPEAGKTAGKGSCNRFFGPAAISGSAVKLGPLGSTRMACPEAVMNQQKKYLDVLHAAERFEWKDPYLLIYCKGLEKPLRFTKMQTSKSSTP